MVETNAYGISRLFRYRLCLRCLLGESLLSASSSVSLSRRGRLLGSACAALLALRAGASLSRLFAKPASTLLIARRCLPRLPAQPPSLPRCLPVQRR